MVQMMTALSEATNRLLWAQWRELGAPGSVHGLERTAIDPEWLIVYTPWLAEQEPRLLETAFDWSAHNHSWISTRRIQAVAKAAPPDTARAFEAWAAGLVQHQRSPWVKTSAEPSGRLAGRRLEPDFHRPSLAVLRARALLGDGARSDVVCALLRSPAHWFFPSDFGAGYTRRAVATALSDFERARLVQSRDSKSGRQFRLRDPDATATLLGVAAPFRWPNWPAVYSVQTVAANLDSDAFHSASTSRVLLANARAAVTPLVDQLGWPPLPDPDNQLQMTSWVATQLEAMLELDTWFESLLCNAIQAHFSGSAVVNAPLVLGDFDFDAVVQRLPPHSDLVFEFKRTNPLNVTSLRNGIRAASTAGQRWHGATRRPTRIVLVIIGEASHSETAQDAAELAAEMALDVEVVFAPRGALRRDPAAVVSDWRL